MHSRTASRRPSLVLIAGLVGGWLVPLAADAAPVISPVPRVLSANGSTLSLPANITVVAGASADPAAVALTRSVLLNAGSTSTVTTTEPASGPTLYIGGPSETPASAGALSALGVAGPSGLAAEGYVLAANTGSDGRLRVVLSGVDKAGTYYAAQSLGQLLLKGSSGATLPAVSIRDWPGYRLRGGMESFYGPVWTQEDRLAQLDFLARNKMNTFFYGPAGDDRTGTTWKLLYGSTELTRLQQIVSAASARHIQFIYRISPEAPLRPENGICHARASDRQALLARLQQVWDIGVRSFTIAWDDVPGQFVCDEDRQAYGADPQPLAAAQAAVSNFVQSQFIATHPGAAPLLIVPTEYFGNQTSGYRTRFDALLTSAATVFWTGPQVISPTITGADLTAAASAFPRHKLALWDNYPVNDYVTHRLLLGPVRGRAGELAGRTEGITFNEMPEHQPSLLPLFTAADYAWNPTDYQPAASWSRALVALGGPQSSALRTFAENNTSSVLDPAESASLAPLITSFLQAWRTGSGLSTAASNLKQAFATLADAPAVLRQAGADPLFAAEAAPWLDKAVLAGRAGQAAVDLLVNERAGAATQAATDRKTLGDLVTQLTASAPVIGPGVLGPLFNLALGRGTDSLELGGDGRADLLGVLSDGTLVAFDNLSSSGGFTSFGPRVTVGQGWSASNLPIVGDLDGDRRADVLSIHADGTLWQFLNKGGFGGTMFPSGVQVGQGWTGAHRVWAVDLDGDGRADLLGVLGNGTLVAFRNLGVTNGVTAFGPGVQVGSGWSASNLPILGDLNGDRRVDVLTVRADGTLWQFLNTGGFGGGPMFATEVRVGEGWAGSLRVRAVDLSGDGQADLLGVLGDGTLVAFRNLGGTNGVTAFGPRVSVGQGWSASNLPIPSDLNGDGRADLLSITPSGALLEYLNTGAFEPGMFWMGGTQVGQGWTGALFLL
jgi:beta-N-acetylglucosaminidase/Glycosyl hydrolase family 20, domain 2/FG-GAP-like repeat